MSCKKEVCFSFTVEGLSPDEEFLVEFAVRERIHEVMEYLGFLAEIDTELKKGRQ